VSVDSALFAAIDDAMPTKHRQKLSFGLAGFPELAKLPKAHRLTLADELWMSGIGDKMPVPQWHQETLDQRWLDYQAGKTKRLTLKQLKQRLVKQ
jgi:hypothetical protein